MPTLHEFVTRTEWSDLSHEARHEAKRCLLDLIGVAAAGTTTELSRIIRDHAAAMFGTGQSGGARLFFDGRLVSPAGAAMANGMTIDSIDAHDGHPLTKGHAGCGILPALIAMAEAEGRRMSGKELLTALAIGYEVAIRAGVSLHATAPDYHTSGAWVAVGAAALSARILKLDEATMREAMGVAEYHGPRSQMMRAIDHPTMVKDGSGWGAMSGVSAAYLARSGFTGAPAITVEAPAVAEFWTDLGDRWMIAEQYMKPYPVCRWAQPAIEAALDLKREHGFHADEIETLRVVTFHEASRLAAAAPTTTEQAQYSLPFPVAAALVHDRVSVSEIDGPGLCDPNVLTLASKIEMAEDDDFNAVFPRERWARVEIDLASGAKLTSQPSIGRGNADNPLSDEEINEKFETLTGGALSRIRPLVWGLDALPDIGSLTEALAEPYRERLPGKTAVG